MSRTKFYNNNQSLSIYIFKTIYGFTKWYVLGAYVCAFKSDVYNCERSEPPSVLNCHDFHYNLYNYYRYNYISSMMKEHWVAQIFYRKQ